MFEKLDPRTKSMAASVLASYAKRWLDSSLYDRLGSSSWMRQLREMSSSKKYGAEFALAVTSAYLKDRLAGDGAWGVLADVTGDAGSEISRRLLADIRTQLRHSVKASDDADIADALLELDNDRLYAVLRAVAADVNYPIPSSGQQQTVAASRSSRSSFIDADIEAAKQRLKARMKRARGKGDAC